MRAISQLLGAWPGREVERDFLVRRSEGCRAMRRWKHAEHDMVNSLATSTWPVFPNDIEHASLVAFSILTPGDRGHQHGQS